MTVIYRILSLIIGALAIMLAISLITSVSMVVSSAQTLLSAFMIVGLILYSWFSFRFTREVLQQKKIVSHKLRDWVRVNGIVTIVFSCISVIGIIPLLLNPQPFMDAVRNFGVEIPLKTAIGFFRVMLAFACILLIHIPWTFALMRKNREFFQ